MTRIVPLALTALLLTTFGCASGGSNADKRLEVARDEVSRMAPPSRKLSSYAEYELLPMNMGDTVLENEKKVAYGEKLQGLLEDKFSPLFSEWRSGGGGSGTLHVRADLTALKVVSGGARFWAGAMAGNSSIDMDLVLIDAASGDVIGSPRINRSSDAMAGGWSVGASDQNLLNYIVDISAQYLIENY